MLETIATVRENRAFGAGYCQLRIELPNAFTVLPGQFAMLKPAGLIEPLLRRAMAFYRVEVIGDRLIADFIFHILGRGTEALSRLRAGDSVEFLGPLGKSFSLEPALSTGNAIIIAGGVGVPAILMLAEQFRAQSINTEIFLGARSQADLIGEEDLRALSFPLTIATDDGSVGEKGFVTAPFQRFLSTLPDQRYIVYTCGPDVMMMRAAEIARAHGLQTFASLEARMACGFGVCVGCVVEIEPPNCEAAYQRVCVEGPVFDASEVIW